MFGMPTPKGVGRGYVGTFFANQGAKFGGGDAAAIAEFAAVAN